jgi:hypothetical protein
MDTASKLPNLDLAKLNIKEDDRTANKLFMLVEGTYGIGVQRSAKKYGYTEQRYYQLKKEFMEHGSGALADKKRGPKGNRVRVQDVEKQIIRLRFLDPKSDAAVISQKLGQMGMAVSERSVERTITQYGLQKKTLQT